MEKIYRSILEEAHQAAIKAHKECVPMPMSFYPTDLNGKQLGPATIEMEGNCGGAYIKGIHGKDPLVKFFKKYGKATVFNQHYVLDNGIAINKGVYTGYVLYIPYPDYRGQSHEKYRAGAQAFAKVLNKNGIKCVAYDYLD